MLRRDAVMTMEFVQTIAQSENTSAYFESEFHEKGKTVFENFFKRIATMPEVVRVNIYSMNGIVVWSDQDRFIGHNFMPNPELIEALSGRLAIGSGTSGKPKKAEHVFDKEVPFFAEIYIPIWNNAKDRVVGAVEVYKVPLVLFDAIKKGDLLVWVSAVLGGLFLYASLFWIVRRAAIIIRKQQDQLVECEACVAMASLGELASAVAHSIRNPLASIRSSAEMTLVEDNSPFCRQTAEDTILQVDRIEGWVRDLLTSSQPIRNVRMPIHFNDLIRDTLHQFEKDMEKRGIKLLLELEESLPLLQGDAALLGQMLNSLISNSIDAMPDGGVLTILSQTPEDRSLIEMKMIDTGIGIPEGKIDKVFKPFFTTKQKGWGMGLYLANRIAKRHGGTIEISSVAGQGTTIFLIQVKYVMCCLDY
ncbi:MAG TPA: ATP-binding protein [Nitrospiria bacterium]|nr:ATP-binding protein [Nitrospiria bacterium]